MADNPRIVILGAGLAGLACACRLSELGFRDVTLLEKRPRPGGLAVSIEYEGHKSDLGPHRIHSEVPEVLEFLKKWAGDILFRRPRKSHMYLGGRFLPYPPTATSVLKRFGVFRMAGFAGSLVATRLSQALSPPKSANYETVMEKAFGRALYRAIVKPYTEKTWGMKASELSPAVARARVSAGGLGALARRVMFREKKGKETSLEEFSYVRGGIGELPRRLHERLGERGVKFILDAGVTALSKEGDAWRVDFSRDGRPRSVTGDFCFSTIPLPGLVQLTQKVQKDEAASRAAGGLDYLAMVLIFLRVRRPRLSGDTWLYFPEPELIFNRGYETGAFDPELSPEGESLICLEVTCREGDATWKCDDENLARRVISDFIKTRLAKETEVAGWTSRRLTHAYPVYAKGFRERLERVWSYLERFPRLVSLGRQGLFHHNNMDHSIHEGLEAAEIFARKKETAGAAWYGDLDRFYNLRIVD